MEINELETFIRFAKSNSMMNWPFEDVLNEYETTQMHHKEPKFDPKTLQPFDKVLVRNSLFTHWQIDFFGYINSGKKFVSCSAYWNMCIPYNEETKHLLGTNNDCLAYYKWWEE